MHCSRNLFKRGGFALHGSLISSYIVPSFSNRRISIKMSENRAIVVKAGQQAEVCLFRATSFHLHYLPGCLEFPMGAVLISHTFWGLLLFRFSETQMLIPMFWGKGSGTEHTKTQRRLYHCEDQSNCHQSNRLEAHLHRWSRKQGKQNIPASEIPIWSIMHSLDATMQASLKKSAARSPNISRKETKFVDSYMEVSSMPFCVQIYFAYIIKAIQSTPKTVLLPTTSRQRVISRSRSQTTWASKKPPP